MPEPQSAVTSILGSLKIRKMRDNAYIAKSKPFSGDISVGESYYRRKPPNKQLIYPEKVINKVGYDYGTALTPENFFLDYSRSPEYKRKLELQGEDKPSEYQRVQNTMKDVSVSIDEKTIPRYFQESVYSGNNAVQSLAYYNPDKIGKESQIFLNTKESADDIKSTNIDLAKKHLFTSTYPHELAHVFRDLGDFAKNSINIKNKYRNELKWLTSEGDPEDEHDKAPNELYSDLTSLRYIMNYYGHYDVRKGDLTLDVLKKGLLDPNVANVANVQRLLKKLKLEDIVKINNEIAQSSLYKPQNILNKDIVT